MQSDGYLIMQRRRLLDFQTGNGYVKIIRVHVVQRIQTESYTHGLQAVCQGLCSEAMPTNATHGRRRLHFVVLLNPVRAAVVVHGQLNRDSATHWDTKNGEPSSLRRSPACSFGIDKALYSPVRLRVFKGCLSRIGSGHMSTPFLFGEATIFDRWVVNQNSSRYDINKQDNTPGECMKGRAQSRKPA